MKLSKDILTLLKESNAVDELIRVVSLIDLDQNKSYSCKQLLNLEEIRIVINSLKHRGIQADFISNTYNQTFFKLSKISNCYHCDIEFDDYFKAKTCKSCNELFCKNCIDEIKDECIECYLEKVHLNELEQDYLSSRL